MGWYTKSERTSYDENRHGSLHRSVKWPNGAPCPKDVPHAGALVRISTSTRYKVLSGIPVEVDTSWCLHCKNCSTGAVGTYPLQRMTPFYEDKEPCYTEEQIRQAHSQQYMYADTLIRRLKEDGCK